MTDAAVTACDVLVAADVLGGASALAWFSATTSVGCGDAVAGTLLVTTL